MGAKETASCIPGGRGIGLVLSTLMLMRVNNCYFLGSGGGGCVCTHQDGRDFPVLCLTPPLQSALTARAREGL